MVLADTSVWIQHFRLGNIGLAELLNQAQVYMHPFIIGELACGTLKNRREILSLLSALSEATPADHSEVLDFISRHQLMGKGLGYIDMHLLASAVLSDIPLWTLDKRLHRSAAILHVAYRSKGC